MSIVRLPRPEWSSDQALDDTTGEGNYSYPLTPEYNSVSTWGKAFDADGPTYLVPDGWLVFPMCNAHWRPIPPVEEFDALFRLKCCLREERRDEILDQDRLRFRISKAFCSITTQALARLNPPDPLSRAIVIGHIVEYAVRMAHALVLNQKAIYKRARPVHYFPELAPIIWPGHPSYPSGHSTEAHTAAYLLDEVMRLPHDPFCDLRNELTAKAWRIAHNREIAGVHFTSDTQAGQDLARRLVDYLVGCKAFAAELASLRASFV
jgi:hypothetical protein